jgi:hypothetical protein
MGLRPTRGDENQRRPRESGDPLSVQWTPACAGMTRLSAVSDMLAVRVCMLS